MKRIKLAWRVLTGKAHVLEMERETYDSFLKSAEADGMKVSDVLGDAAYLYEEQVGGSIRETRQRDLRVEEGIRKILAGEGER